MKHTIGLHKVLVVVAVSFFVLSALQNNATAQFDEQFNSSTLDPAWQVVTFTEERVYGYTSPANHISLTDNPGHLRYYLDPMTHFDGFAYGFQTSYGLHSCCNHDPGLELRRTISGDNWLLEARAEYYLPFTNGRYFTLDVYFGDGDIGTFSVQFQRLMDLNQNYLRIMLAEKTGPDPYNSTLEDLWVPIPIADHSIYYFELNRSGSVLTAMWSEDGATWNPGFTHDMGTLLDGLEQTVVVTGLSWFNTGGSYADWDYIKVTPATKTVSIDIKPGSYPNAINLSSAGVVPVAILSTSTFDATQIDPATVSLAGAKVKLIGKGDKFSCSAQDVNGDGRLDLMCHVLTAQFMIETGSSVAILEATTLAGQAIRGEDTVQIVP